MLRANYSQPLESLGVDRFCHLKKETPPPKIPNQTKYRTKPITAGVKEFDTGLAHRAFWDLNSDQQAMKEEQPLQVCVRACVCLAGCVCVCVCVVFALVHQASWAHVFLLPGSACVCVCVCARACV